ncbi:hypothetical protein BGW80DRAFT_622515 [Lactifluus volemus]|nr:hypothetical protein BGW80DRAFT_622515 [Lactifluus volemus]
MSTIPSRLSGFEGIKDNLLWIVDSRFTVLLASDISKSLKWEGIEPCLIQSQVLFKPQAFDDRLGTYTISTRAPYSHIDSDVALPHIRVHLYNPTGALKFSASLRAKHVAPFRNTHRTRSTRDSPIHLLPRILRQAAVPHCPGRRHLIVLEQCCVGHLAFVLVIRSLGSCTS